MNGSLPISDRQSRLRACVIGLVALTAGLWMGVAHAFTVNVQAPDGTPVSGFRRILEQDTTHKDAFGNPLGTTCQVDAQGNVNYNPDGTPATPLWVTARFWRDRTATHWSVTATPGTIAGTVVNAHNAVPPDFTFSPGHPLPNCWIGSPERGHRNHGRSQT